MYKEHFEINEDDYKAFQETYGYKDLVDGVDRINFDNVHEVGKLMFERLDIEIIQGLINELEAQLMFGKNK